MIKANELKLNNLLVFTVDGNKEICQVDGLTKEYVDLKVASTGSYLEDDVPIERCNPIPLTPEWLDRCRFEDMGSYWQYNGEPGFVLIKDNDGGVYIGNPVRTYVKTVHHLQNVYFDLTEGVELQIKIS